MIAAYNFVNESNRVICIAYDALALCVYGHIVSCKNIFARSFAVCLKIRRDPLFLIKSNYN